MSEDLTYTIILSSFLMPLLLSAILVFFVIRYQRNKRDHEIEIREAQLKEQALIIEKQTALEKERTRIAGELHDDLGGGLTSIQFLSQGLLRNNEDESEKASLNKIVRNSKSLIENTSEIIWAMNAGFDSIGSLVSFCRRYASEYLSDFGIKLSFQSDLEKPNEFLSGEKRRNLFLVFKEAIHNIVKHADAKEVEIVFTTSNNNLKMFIKDNGLGFNQQSIVDVKNVSNGLTNMRNRIDALGGVLKIESENGTVLDVRIPLLSK